MTDARLHYPATQRNREAILAVLWAHLPAQGLVIEIASGSGEHAVHFARAFPRLVFQPSDPDPHCRASIAAWAGEADLPNLRPPLALDVRTPWPLEAADAVLCINMIHIAPWAAAEGLMAGAGNVLRPGGVLILYGPYKRGGTHSAPSNAAFDERLRGENPEWGVRDLEDVAALAAASGFGTPAIVEVPANNLALVFRKDLAQPGGASHLK